MRLLDHHMTRAMLPSGHRKGRNRNRAMVAALTTAKAAAVQRSSGRLAGRACSAASTAGTVKYLQREREPYSGSCCAC